MKVWLAEKSSFGKDLAAVLGNPKPVTGIMNCWDTDRGRVVCASGHLIEFAKPEDYDPAYAQWSLDHLPIIPPTWRLKEIEGKTKWLNSIRQGMKGATEIIVATDAGREGEYIAWLILSHLGLGRIPKQRLWSSGANKAAIAKSVEKLLPYAAKYMLAEAAQIRAESDWIEGMNLTRLCTTRFKPDGHREPISVGRVQTAVLAIIVRRTREIKEFKPQEYREISLKVVSGPHTIEMHHRPPESRRMHDAAKAIEICQKINNVEASLIVASEDRQEKPPTLFESSTLQIRAYNLWGWPAERTEAVAQSLYDEHKLISYPRTDGIYLEDEQWGDVATVLGNIAATKGFDGVTLRDTEKFGDLSVHIPASLMKRKEVFSTTKLAASGADHHGIIPTIERADLTALTDDERRLYALIVRQYLAQFHLDCSYRQKRVSWTAAGVEFSTIGRTIVNPGWRVLFGANDEAANKAEATGPEIDDEDARIPPIENGAMGIGTYPRVVTKITRAPKQYTEGSIIGAMRDLSTLATNDEMRAVLRQASSIGTKSTMGETIKKLKERLYIASSKGKLSPTTLGEDLIALFDKNVPKVVSIETTALLERMLLDVEQGKMDPDTARKYLQTRNINAIRLCLAAEDTKLRAPQGGATKGKSSAKPASAPFVDSPGGSWALEVPFDDREAVKSLGGRFNGETRKWHMPKTGCASEDELRRRGWIK